MIHFICHQRLKGKIVVIDETGRPEARRTVAVIRDARPEIREAYGHANPLVVEPLSYGQKEVLTFLPPFQMLVHRIHLLGDASLEVLVPELPALRIRGIVLDAVGKPLSSAEVGVVVLTGQSVGTWNSDQPVATCEESVHVATRRGLQGHDWCYRAFSNGEVEITVTTDLDGEYSLPVPGISPDDVALRVRYEEHESWHTVSIHESSISIHLDFAPQFLGMERGARAQYVMETLAGVADGNFDAEAEMLAWLNHHGTIPRYQAVADELALCSHEVTRLAGQIRSAEGGSQRGLARDELLELRRRMFSIVAKMEFIDLARDGLAQPSNPPHDR